MGRRDVSKLRWSRLRRAAVLGGLATGVFAACSAGENGENISSFEQPVVDLILLSEVKVDPPGPSEAYQYIELRGTPGGSLEDYYIVALNGQNGGVADFVIDLGSACAGVCSFGENGLLLLTKTGGHTTVAPTPSAIVDTIDFETGSVSLLVVLSETTPLTAGTDYDTDTAGTLDLPEGATVIDAVGWGNQSSDDEVVWGGAELLLTGLQNRPDAITRFATDNTPKSAAAWYFGDLDPDQSGPATAYDLTDSSENTPAGASITPGAVNFAPAVVGEGGAGGGGAGGAPGAAGAVGLAGAAGSAGEGGVGGEGGAGGSPSLPTGGTSGNTGTAGTAGLTGVGGDVGEAGSGGAPVVNPPIGGEGGVPSGAAGEGGSDPGTGGTGGASAGRGGTAGSAPVAGSGGRAGSGGTAGAAGRGGNAGRAGAAGAPTNGGGDDDDDGCGCRTPGRGSSTNGAFAALAAALAVVLRRRRRDKR